VYFRGIYVSFLKADFDRNNFSAGKDKMPQMRKAVSLGGEQVEALLQREVQDGRPGRMGDRGIQDTGRA